MLSDHDIDVLVTKMGIRNFKRCFYKDKLKTMQPNSSYIINLNSELDEHGNRNSGSHWVALVINDIKQGIYFDSYGEREPVEIKNLLKSNQYKLGYTSKNIQSLMSNLCVFFLWHLYISYLFLNLEQRISLTTLLFFLTSLKTWIGQTTLQKIS
jgi:hypothetical protein